jgi:integrase
MSIEKRQLQSGGVAWRVRWREGGHNRVRQFDRKRDAEGFDAEIRRRKRLGELDLLDAGRETLADFAREWWRLYAEPNLERATLVGYAGLWDRYVLPRLGGFELRALTPELLEACQADLRAAGVGDPTIRKTLAIIQSVLQRAVIWRRIPSNPAAAIRKPSQRRSRTVRPLAPASVERIRAQLLEDGRQGDATLVSVLAYAGLRPGEALALRWSDIRDRTILVERAIALGEVKSTKTGKTRSVRLLGPLGSDLAQWKLASGRPPDQALVFPRRDGDPWSDFDWRNWRRRLFAPTAAAAGLDRIRPYDLRHSFVSLLLAEGASVVEVARQAGHSPTMALSTYAHVIEELEGAERRPAEAVIREARDELVPLTYPRAGDRRSG